MNKLSQDAVGDAGTSKGDLCGGQVVFGLGELFFKEEAALLRLGHGELAHEDAQLLHVGVGVGQGGGNWGSLSSTSTLMRPSLPLAMRTFSANSLRASVRVLAP